MIYVYIYISLLMAGTTSPFGWTLRTLQFQMFQAAACPVPILQWRWNPRGIPKDWTTQRARGPQEISPRPCRAVGAFVSVKMVKMVKGKDHTWWISEMDLVHVGCLKLWLVTVFSAVQECVCVCNLELSFSGTSKADNMWHYHLRNIKMLLRLFTSEWQQNYLELLVKLK